MQLAIFGKTPQLSLAELISLHSTRVTPISDIGALVGAESIDIDRLGGTIKLGQLIGEIDGTNWQDAANYLAQNAPEHLDRDSKQNIGISVYGLKLPAKEVGRVALDLKKSLKGQGYSIRVVPNQSPTLNSAQLLHNKLTEKGAEFVVVAANNKMLVAKTVGVQDIEAYSDRDYARPKRDRRVGMLPPKLAQTMINLALGPQRDLTLLDPFCGTGVLLQEALLMGYNIQGSDINKRMVDYTRQNLEWLTSKYGLPENDYPLAVADATEHSWPQPIDAVVSEIYLGEPLTSEPDADRVAKLAREAKKLISGFLKNISNQIEPSTPVVLAVPAWRSDKQLVSPPIDQMARFGYNRKSFAPVGVDDMVYIRPQQFTGRKIIVLERV